MHKEWFPLNYPTTYYNKLLSKDNIVAYGCFVEIKLDEYECSNDFRSNVRKLVLDGDDQVEFGRNDGKRELMLGAIISKVRDGKRDAVEIYNLESSTHLRNKSFLHYLAGLTSCTARLLSQEDRPLYANELEACYI